MREVRQAVSRWFLLRLFLVLPLLSASPSEAQTLAGGEAHTVVLKPDGTVWTFGDNSQGQLGDNTLTDRKTPIQVGGLSDIVAVAAGGNHSLALTSGGALLAWGDNFYGQLGDGTTTDRKTPVTIAISDVIAIGAGFQHTIALRSTGDVYLWGRNNFGQLGTGNTTNASSPTLIMGSVTAVGAGYEHSALVKTDGTAWAAGRNLNGELGDGSTTQRTSFVQMSGVASAAKVGGGSRHSLVLLSDGTLKAVGLNSSGQLGDGTATQRTTAVAVNALSSVTAIAVGFNHSIARKSDGTAWAWGYNYYGQVGDGTTSNRNTATQVVTLSSVTKIGAGHYHSAAVTSTGVVSTWGRNSESQLGDGTLNDRATPSAISGENYDWKVATPTFNVAAGTYSTDRTVTVSVATSGATIHYTQDGDEPTESDPTIASGSTMTVSYSQTLKARAWKAAMPPSDTQSAIYTMRADFPIFSPSGGSFTSPPNVTMTSTTPGVTIRYTTDGSDPTESSTAYAGAVNVPTTTTLKAIAFKANWSPSLTMSRTYTMSFGTLAPPTVTPAAGTYESQATVSMSTPQSGATIRYTTNGSTPSSSSTAYVAPFAVEATATVKAKAFHPDYATSPETSRAYAIVVAAPTFAPVGGTYAAGQAITVSTATGGAVITYTLDGSDPTAGGPAIAPGHPLVGGSYTLKARAWKTGATASATTSATYNVTGSVAVPSVAGGAAHSLAVRSDGTAWGWGANGGGQLGDGIAYSPDRLLPQMVPGTTGAAAVAAGGSHSLVLRTDATVLAFGSNYQGRLGDGTTTDRLLPITVPGLSGVAAIAASAFHSLAARLDGSVVGWGSNTYGQIGDGTTTHRLTPTAVTGLSGIVDVEARSNFSLALASGGSVWSWGANGSGQLGDGTTTSRPSPTMVTGIATAQAIAAGEYHAVVLLDDGTLRSWGHNSWGQLGDGTTADRTIAVAVQSLSNATRIAAGSRHTLALKSDGTVWSFGANVRGQLGDGTTTDRAAPVPVVGLSGIVAIAAGDDHSLALNGDGVVYAWGYNADGQLGDGTTENRSVPVAISTAAMNWRVATPTISVASGLYLTSQAPVVAVTDPEATLRFTIDGSDPIESSATVSSGGTVSIEQSATLKVRAWKPGAPASVIASRVYELKVVTPTMSPGQGAYGGAQSVAITTSTPSATIRYTTDGSEPTLTSAVSTGTLSVGGTLTLKARGYRPGWTASDSGFASYWISDVTVATPVIAPAGGTFGTPPLVTLASATPGATIRYTLDSTEPSSASPIYRHPFLVATTATVKARGFRSGSGASAIVSATYSLDDPGQTPAPTVAPAGGRYATRQTVAVAGPVGATMRYTTSGVDPAETDALVPANGEIVVDRALVLKVRAWAAGQTPSDVRRADFVVEGALIAGRQHSLAIAADRTLYAWGDNTSGALGDGTVTRRLSPVAVLTDVVAAAAGNQFSVAVRADGSVWTWGKGTQGQLGRPPTGLLPGAIPALTGVVSVSAGYAHVLALKSDGTVVAWGENGDGQLGDDTTTNRPSPVPIAGLSGVTAVSAGHDHSTALQTNGSGNGTVWAWGANGDGQLGDGSGQPRLKPVRVVGLDTVAQVSAGRKYSLARLANGDVRSWGINDKGQLGIGSNEDQLLAVAVPGLARAHQIAAAEWHALAVDAVGVLWGWGDHGYGQLGTENNTNPNQVRLVPTRLHGFSAAVRTNGAWQHTLVGRADGGVLAMGGNSSGQLGDGTQTLRLQPTAIPGFSLAPNASMLADPDADGLPTWLEYSLGFDPLNRDTNGNGFSDLTEANGGGGSSPDEDGDGVPSYLEAINGTDPFVSDSDGDGVNDLADAFPLDATRSAPLSPTPGDTTPPVITLTEPVSAVPRPPL